MDSKEGYGMHEDESTRSSTLPCETPEAIARDVYVISRIEMLPLLLDVLCDITGMGFAAVARVSDISWTVCAVKDKINFGLKVADQLPLESTLCIESRRSGEPIVIDHASRDPRYSTHRTPKAYRIESYISVPIFLRNGRHFGNLCAVDPAPARVSVPAITNTFRRFASLIAFQVEGDESADRSSDSPATHLTTEWQDHFFSDLRQALVGPIRAIRDVTDAIDTKANDAVAVKGLATRIRTTALTISSLVDNLKHGIPQSTSLDLIPELPAASVMGDLVGDRRGSLNRADRSALESLLMLRVGELNSHLGRYDMYALTIHTWLIKKGAIKPRAEPATIRERGSSILHQLRLLAVNESMIVEFDDVNRQVLDVLARQEIVAKKGASIPSLREAGPLRTQAVVAAERAWFDHVGAQTDELLVFIAAMERDICTVVSLYIRLAGWAGRLELSIK